MVDSDETQGRQVTLYVGSISPHATPAELRAVFSNVCPIERVEFVTDPITGRMRGIAFVAISESDADRAIAEIDATRFYQRRLRIERVQDLAK